MGAIALQDDFADLIPAPPMSDWLRMLEFAESIKEFDRAVDKFDTSMKVWRLTVSKSLQTGLSNITEKLEQLDGDAAAAIVLPVIDKSLVALEDVRDAYSVPLHQEDDISARLLKLSGGPGRHIRKQFKRVEDIRVLQYNLCVDLYYTLLAFRSEYELDSKDGKVFTDPSELGDFLRKSVA